MYYNSTPYFYILNLQGDVIRMVDGVGNIVANYEYDPYGKVISATGWLAEVNPLRYRGYYYDTETQLYHLWSRYYDPQTGRFISADSYAITGQGVIGNNMFAYCNNNPISNYDSKGTFMHALLGGIITAVIAVVTLVNYAINAVHKTKIKKEIKESYTRVEAKAAIEEVLPSSGNHTVSYDDAKEEVRITNSHTVTSRYQRQKVSMILERTEGLTDREYDNMAAEWNVHNAIYDILTPINQITSNRIGTFVRYQGSAQDVDINYSKDYRPVVVIATKIFEVLGWD